MIRDATAEDAAAVTRIYNHYIEHTVVSFELEPVTVEEMAGRMAGVLEDHLWIVHEADDEISGYAYAGTWNSRCAYEKSVESSVYLDHEATGKGIGSALYEHLLGELKQRSFHTAIGGIALPNPASVALHEKFGFEKVAHYQEVGWKFGKWIDVGYWQRML